MNIPSLSLVTVALAFAAVGCNASDPSAPASLSALGSSLSPSPSPSREHTPPGGPSPSNAVSLDREETAFVAIINAYRGQNGLAKLKISRALTISSKWMSADMAARDYLDHTDSQGRDPFVRMAAFGYDYDSSSAENIADGNESAQGTFEQWRDSPAHNANMLSAEYTVIGVGRASNPSSDYGWYWTTDFGSEIDKLLAD